MENPNFPTPSNPSGISLTMAWRNARSDRIRQAIGQGRVRPRKFGYFPLPPYPPAAFPSGFPRRRRYLKPIFMKPKRLSLKISFPKRLRATSTRKIRIQMKISLRSGGAFGRHFGPPNGSRTLRRRFVNGGRSHFGPSKPLIFDNSFP